MQTNRWRAWLRVHLPYRPPLYMLVPKSKKYCKNGDHSFYREDELTIGCSHCQIELSFNTQATQENFLRVHWDLPADYKFLTVQEVIQKYS